MNYGELITPHPLPELVLQDPDGRPVPLSALKGKWTMVQVDEGQKRLVLENGQVKTQGSVAEVFANIEQPMWVGEDMGAWLQGSVVERHADWHLCRVAFDGGQMWLRDSGVALGQMVRMRVLARDVSIATEAPLHTSIQNQLSAVIEAVAPDAHPSQVLVRLRVGPWAVLARITQKAWSDLSLHIGQAVWVQVKSVAVVA